MNQGENNEDHYSVAARSCAGGWRRSSDRYQKIRREEVGEEGCLRRQTAGRLDDQGKSSMGRVGKEGWQAVRRIDESRHGWGGCRERHQHWTRYRRQASHHAQLRGKELQPFR